ncbi:hypothetical protein K435DRAFT_773547 [Dendrothele bispora CBS 962.96]|uniref:C2H2-type domain-containing protein n=1 Tax=Dendrothele bispora (strain CBS 962.96) TaxID=1314807 RepID=A0A4S8MSG1_DENBC|nr:hypothetical protein K435DRAFT_773547 [Dendrothele bispora CBS 962.96]
MSDPQSAPYPAGSAAYDSYNNPEYNKQQQYQQQAAFDFLPYHAPADVLAPHPDLFDSELDSSLAGFDELQFQLLTVENNDAFSFLRSDTPTCGPPSTITVSSESASAYDSYSAHSESLYNYPQSPYAASNYSFPLELEMDFQRIRVDPVADYANNHASQVNSLDAVDPSAFGSLPPTPPRSPPNHAQAGAKVYTGRSSFSDYGPPSRNSISHDYYSQVNYGATHLNAPTVSPVHVNSQLPVVPSIPLVASPEEFKGDPRKKYKCTICPRAFARAYNLKTHMATHDPNRLKPHVCPHRSCGRSFSRKHDLGRHLISIHRDESVCSSQHSKSSKHSIGVEKGPRSWCEHCGKGSIGRNVECECNDVK